MATSADGAQARVDSLVAGDMIEKLIYMIERYSKYI